MLTFIRPDISHTKLITSIAAKTFIESHGNSASEKDIDAYVKSKFTEANLEHELSDPNAVFRLAYYDNVPVGYSKIIFDCPNPNIDDKNICKMERLYVLKDHLDKKIGQALFNENLNLAKNAHQKGIWLFVWTGNERALRFYDRQGFKKIGDTYFKISETHSNPNYWYYLEF